MEHLPRVTGTYRVTPVSYDGARRWLLAGDLVSLVRTTELIDAVRASFGVHLEQAESATALQAGDEALLICLSFSVLLGFAEAGITPLNEDWRCHAIVAMEADAEASEISAAAKAEAPSELELS